MPSMREIVLKTVKGEENTISYQEMILSLTKAPNGQGVSVDEMEQIMPIRRAVKSAVAEEGQDPKALITEEQFNKLVGIVTSFKGYVVCEENSQFVKDIKESKSVEVAPV